MMSSSLFLLSCLVVAVNGQRMSFIGLGDWGTGTLEQTEVADAMNEWAQTFNPQFILTSGDNFYSEGIEGPDDPRWETYWRAVYTGDKIQNLPWQVSVGNHDYYPRDSGYEWNQVDYTSIDPRWNLPNLRHSFYANSSLGAIHFIISDSQGLRRRQNDPEGQLEWIQQELQNSQGVMKIFVAHHPIFSSGNYGPGSGTMQSQVLPLLQQYNVDLFICGHDHNLQFLRYDDGSALEFILTGGGGRRLYGENLIAKDTLKSEFGVDSNFFFSYGFVGFTVDEGSDAMRIQYRDEDNVLLYDLLKKPGQPSTVNPV